MEVVPRYTHTNLSKQNVIKYLVSLLAYEENPMNLELRSSIWLFIFELFLKESGELWNLCPDKSTFTLTYNLHVFSGQALSI